MNLTLTERDKKLLGLTACLAILAVFGVHLIRPALAERWEANMRPPCKSSRNIRRRSTRARPSTTASRRTRRR